MQQPKLCLGALALGCVFSTSVAFVSPLSAPRGFVAPLQQPQHQQHKQSRGLGHGSVGVLHSALETRRSTSMIFRWGRRDHQAKSRQSSSALRMVSGTDDVQGNDKTGVRRLVLGGIWAGLVAWAFLFAPGNNPAAKALDAQLVTAMIANLADTNVDLIFRLVFNALGLMPLLYAGILLPGSKDQKPVPAFPFILSSMALGFFGLGPYVALREYKPSVNPESLGWLAKGANSKAFGGVCLLYLLGLCYTATTGDLSASWPEFLRLASTQQLVNVSSVDFVILSGIMWEPLKEDMRRRGWFSDGSGNESARLAAYSLPLFGPVAYLLTRPPLSAAEE